MSAETAVTRGAVVGSGGEDAFVRLFYDHDARLVKLARLLGADDPEDAVQEAFCKLYAVRERLERDDVRVVAYLNKTLVNEVRSRQRRKLTALRAPLHLFAPQHRTDDDHEVRRTVIDALHTLPVRKREALVLRYWADLSLAEVADVMGIRVGTVKSTISRGLEDLEARLGEAS